MRTLFKRKKKLSKAYRTVKSVNRCVSLRRKILEIDIKLKNHYESKQLSDEMKLFEKAKANKNVLYNYIKRKQKSSIKIGPFVKNNIVLNEKPEEILKQQYESIFSSPKEEFLIKNPNEFFNFCDKCLKEELHICSEDSTMSDKNSSPLFGISGITISKMDTLKSPRMIVPNMSAGPDGIPGILLRNCADSLAYPLTLFWNESMRLKKVPDRLKEAWVLP